MGEEPARRVRYRGRVYAARPSEPLLTAISARGIPILERSVRYHRPRAPFCGTGQCTGCLVRVNGRPLVRSCRYRPHDGDVVVSDGGWPSARLDLLGLLDVLFPGGLDPFRGFRRPAFAAPVYQWFVRRLAGYGTLPPPGSPAPPAPAVARRADVVVVGGGASGRAVLDRLATLGHRPLLIDRDPLASAPAGTDLLPGVSVTLLTPPDPSRERPFTLVGFMDDGPGVAVEARTVVVATGGYDASLSFPGNDRPGVLTADAALGLTPSQERTWFRHAALIGGDRRAVEVLAAHGARIGSVVATGEVRPDVVRAASDLGIPIYPRSLIVGVRGCRRVRALRLQGRGRGPPFSLRCDAVLLAHRRLPNVQLAYLAGARMRWCAGPGAYLPEVDERGRTSVPGLFAVGEAAGVLPVDAAASGERVAEAIAGGGWEGAPALAGVREDGAGDLEGYYRELLAVPRRGRWVACRCEDVLLEDLARAHAAGYRGIEVIKRYTSLGTGLCQGRYCVPDALLLLAVLENRPPHEVGFVRSRPPVFPTPLGALASLDGPARTEVP